CFFFFQAEDGIRDFHVTGVQTCALPIFIPGTEENEQSQYEYMRKARDVTVQKILKFSNVFRELSNAFTQVALQNKNSESEEALRSEERRVGKERRRLMVMRQV